MHGFIISLYDFTLPPDCSNIHTCKPRACEGGNKCKVLQEGGVVKASGEIYQIVVCFVTGLFSISICSKFNVLGTRPDYHLFSITFPCRSICMHLYDWVLFNKMLPKSNLIYLRLKKGSKKCLHKLTYLFWESQKFDKNE